MTGPEFKQLRIDLGDAIGRSLTAADMARLCGLPEAGGADTVRRWEVKGPSGPVAERLRVLAMASERYPIPENSTCSTATTSMRGIARHGARSCATACARKCWSGWADGSTASYLTTC